MTEGVALFLVWLIVSLHAAGISGLVVGTLLALTGRLSRLPLFERLYLGGSGAAAASFLLYGECLLTIWEKRLRTNFLPETAYQGGFISHYLARLGIDVTDRSVFWFLVTVMAVGLASLLYQRTKARTRNSR